MSVWYGVVDTARDPRLYDEVLRTPRHVCLFSGKLHPDVARASPYLVDLDAAPAFGKLWRTHGWGEHWGIVARSPLPFETLRRHFRKFLLSRMPDGSGALFRYYDPRVFRAYLPTADAAELGSWFDGIDEFAVPAEGGGTHRLTVENGTLNAQPPLA